MKIVWNFVMQSAMEDGKFIQIRIQILICAH